MNTLRAIFAGIAAVAVSSCGYHLGGIKPSYMKDMNTFCVEMFANNTVQPNMGMLVTSAVGNTLQSDGTYRMAPRSEADFVIKGTVTHIERTSQRTSSEDSYVSSEIGLTVYVEYEVIDRKTGKVILKGTESGTGNYFNQDINTVSAMDSALSYASRLAAEDIAFNLTSL